LFSRTRIGIAARAAAFDDVAARLVGIRVNRIVLASWALSGAIGALAGILLTPVQADSYNVSFGFLVTAFAAALVGGLGNVVGAMIAGIALGIVESVSLLFISTTAQDAIAFGLIVVVLVVRPKGLFKPSFEKQLN
jgi:branched-chain amino acid transport system permease protein